MKDTNDKNRSVIIGRFISLLIDLPMMEIVAELWRLCRKLWRGMANEGIYEVLEHEGTLEIKDVNGKKAVVRKRQKVQYLQNNIISYQDQAWGDGTIFANYRCSPGIKVDRYRAGHKDVILISLRSRKTKGDTDQFNIDWVHQNGFTTTVEQWGTEINHRTKYLKIQIIFPKKRPPQQLYLVEYLSRRVKHLSPDMLQKMPDGRWLVVWEKTKPRLYEQYGIKWEW